MFLGTPRGWWIAAGVCFVVGLGLIVTGGGGTLLGTIAGVLLLFAAMAVFAAAPMRYGRQKEDASPASPAPSQPAAAPAAAAAPRPRPAIEAGDASEV